MTMSIAFLSSFIAVSTLPNYKSTTKRQAKYRHLLSPETSIRCSMDRSRSSHNNVLSEMSHTSEVRWFVGGPQPSGV